MTDNVKILRGADHLKCYRFNKMKGQHYFCANCGIFIYLIPPEPIFPYAVNLCALENCDWKTITYFFLMAKKLALNPSVYHCIHELNSGFPHF